MQVHEKWKLWAFGVKRQLSGPLQLLRSALQMHRESPRRKSEKGKVIRPYQFGSPPATTTPLNTPRTPQRRADPETDVMELDYGSPNPLDFPETEIITELAPTQQIPRLVVPPPPQRQPPPPTSSSSEIRNAVASITDVDFVNHGRYHDKKK